jgi:hypothetical protein
MSSESRIWEIRLFGSMRGGREVVIGPRAFQPILSRLLYNPAISYNVQWLKDFHHWIRHRNGSHATTIHSDTDRVQGLAVEVEATVRG